MTENFMGPINLFQALGGWRRAKKRGQAREKTREEHSLPETGYGLTIGKLIINNFSTNYPSTLDYIMISLRSLISSGNNILKIETLFNFSVEMLI